MRRIGFTLIELMAVIVLLSVIAGSVTLSLTGTHERRKREDVVGRIGHVDRQARQLAERMARPMVLTLDLRDQQLRYFHADKTNGSLSMEVPAPFEIDRVRVTGIDPRAYTAGTVEVPISSRGRSATYAVRLRNDAEQGGENEHTWLIFAGLTGQMTWINDEKQLDNLLEALGRARPDAD